MIPSELAVRSLTKGLCLGIGNLVTSLEIPWVRPAPWKLASALPLPRAAAVPAALGSMVEPFGLEFRDTLWLCHNSYRKSAVFMGTSPVPMV